MPPNALPGDERMPGRRLPRGEERVYHLGLRPGELPDSVLVPGDPARARRIAESWDRSEALAQNREFLSFRGRYGGVDLGVVSSGIGGPAMAIVVEELARLGVRRIVRVGSCGAIDPRLRTGDLAISLAAARFDPTSRLYAPLEYPAVAEPALLRALASAAAAGRFRYRVGITATVGSFYLDQGRSGFGGFLPEEARRMPALLRKLGILNIEMECATLLTIAAIYGIEAGALCTVYGDREDGRPVPEDPSPAIRVANEALRHRATEGPSAGRRPAPTRPRTARRGG